MTRPSSSFTHSGRPPYGATPRRWSCTSRPRSPHQRYRRAPRRLYHERISVLLSLAAPTADAELLSHALLGYLEPALLWHLSDQCNVPLQRLENGWLELVSRLTRESQPHTT